MHFFERHDSGILPESCRLVGSLSNRIGGDFERHIHFGECAFCLLMN